MGTQCSAGTILPRKHGHRFSLSAICALSRFTTIVFTVVSGSRNGTQRAQRDTQTNNRPQSGVPEILAYNKDLLLAARKNSVLTENCQHHNHCRRIGQYSDGNSSLHNTALKHRSSYI